MDGVCTPPRHDVLGRHPLGTPSDSVERLETTRSKRQSVIAPISTIQFDPPQDSEADTLRGYSEGKFPKAKLPVYKFLAREDGLREQQTGNTAFWNGRIQAWWDETHGSRFKFDGSAPSTSKYLTEIAKDSNLSLHYGLTKTDTKPTMWMVSRYPLSERTVTMERFCLPEGWSEESTSDGSLKFQKEVYGLPVVVTMAKPGLSGATSVEKICFHRHDDVTTFDNLGGIPRIVHSATELNSVLLQVGNLKPCAGIRACHYADDELRQGFSSVARQALRNGQPQDGTVCMGHFPDFEKEGASSTLHVVRDEHVFWHSECGVFVEAASSHRRCKRCATYHSRSFLAKVQGADSLDFDMKTRNELLGTAQKDHKLSQLADQRKKDLREKRRMELAKCKEDDIVIAAGDAQGLELHKALGHEDINNLTAKLPEDSLAKEVVSEMFKWNQFHGSSKGWRFNGKVLRWACYALAKMGSAGYSVLQEVLHLPSLHHVHEIRQSAAPMTSGFQKHNVQAYGKIAAADNAGRFDLAGILAWDLMHINANGFTARPNGGGITGLVDPFAFFSHPLWAVGGIDASISLEDTLEKFVATQYLEVFWVSIGKPSYRFVVWREAVRSLSVDYIARMCDRIMFELSGAHVDKGFDVVATCCDGASEHRSFQKNFGSCPFSLWAKAGSPFELKHKDFNVAFKHIVHLGPVFNLSDSMHLIKKLVNALWHSDIAKKPRALMKLWWDQTTGEFDWCKFSLKTLEAVYREEELGGGTRSPEEQVASLRRFRSLNLEQFHRTSHSCMSVGLSAKCLSDSAVRACDSAQNKLKATGASVNGSISCYSDMAYHMNDFTDIMNGVFGRNVVERKQGRNVDKGFITTYDSTQLQRLLEILSWFDDWRTSLESTSSGTEWKNNFITEMSWFDMRLTILGFVAMCRYIFSDDSLVQEDGGRRRNLNPRTFSQDILEHRFAHIRAGVGSHNRPSKENAYAASRNGDTVRSMHGDRRRNASRSTGDKFKTRVAGPEARAVLPVNAKERANSERAATCDRDDHVYETRSIVLN